MLQPFQAAQKGRALSRGSRHPLVLEHGLAPGLFQRGELQSRVLVVSRDAGTAVFHALHFDPYFWHTSTAIGAGLRARVRPLTLLRHTGARPGAGWCGDRLPFIEFNSAQANTAIYAFAREVLAIRAEMDFVNAALIDTGIGSSGKLASARQDVLSRFDAIFGKM
jgi:hypothetical protein